MKIMDDALCTFCKLNNETIIHLLWKCETTQQFIREVTGWLKDYSIIHTFSKAFFVFGRQNKQPLPYVVKFILLYAKYYICVSRRKTETTKSECF